MTVEKFYESYVRRTLEKEAEASVKLDGETWSLPRFQTGEEVWVAGRPATIVGYLPEGECGAHPGEYRYTIRFLGASEAFTPWPYCESQLKTRN